MPSPYTDRLEASVVQSILTQLDNLGWIVDERKNNCNVTQQRVKTVAEKQKLSRKLPDFVLYQKDTNVPIGIIEAKKPGESLEKALREAEKKYASPLGAPLIFAYNDTYVATRYLGNSRPLKIDGEDVRQFVDHHTALRFVSEGPEILSAPEHVQHSRDQLISIFKRSADLLREAGVQAGLERFGAFSDILFLKIMDEVCELRKHAGEDPPIPEHIRWSHFQGMGDNDRLKYIRDVVWKSMNKQYGSIFSESLLIDDPGLLGEIIEGLSGLNLTASDSDVKGDAFEYFLKNAYQGIKIKDLGEYFTPRNIVRTMVSMVNPKIGETIYDPFCGTGGFLIESYRYIRLRIKPKKELSDLLKTGTVFGSEVTTNARIAKMNMILFGDGHSNVEKHDSFKFPKKNEFDIVLTNPPYSQTTRYGNLYPIPSSDGDAISMLHCFEALKENGRAAVLVKEDFLSEGGNIGKVREYIMNRANNFSVVSLPRKLFLPYTPTKTSIVYFEKEGKRKSTYFFVVKHVGHALTGRKKSIPQNDLPKVLESFRAHGEVPEIESCVVDNDVIFRSAFSLWVYDYTELLPNTNFELRPLGECVEVSGTMVSPSDFPDDDFVILAVTNKYGVIENEILEGREIKQRYKKVSTGDLTYNPHRVNVGSIGIVTGETSGGYVSGIYVVFKSRDKKQFPPEYILALLKSEPYRKIIEAYDTKHGAVRANLTFEQLCRIKIPVLNDTEMARFMKKQNEVNDLKKALKIKEGQVVDHLQTIASKEVNPTHLEDFNLLLKKAATTEIVD